MSTQSKILFKDLANDWLIQKRISVKNSTYVKYRNALNKHIIPELGDIELDSLDNRKILCFVNNKLNYTNDNSATQLSNKTIKDLLLIVNNILKYGKTYYPDNVSSFTIVYPSISRSNIRVLSHIEQQALEQIIYTDMNSIKLGILISLFTGLRIGEMCGLRWEDISLYEGTLSVNRTVQRLQTFNNEYGKKTKIVIDTPKSINSVRKIPLPEFLIPVIKCHYPTYGEGFLLPGKNGSCMEPRTLENYFNLYMKEALELCKNNPYYVAQPEKLTFHSLRHTFATRCVEAGFEIKCLSEILGHANVNITLNRYVHSSMLMKRDNMRKLMPVYSGKLEQIRTLEEA